MRIVKMSLVKLFEYCWFLVLYEDIGEEGGLFFIFVKCLLNEC